MPADTNASPPDADALEHGLRAARLRRGYTQEQVAALVNTSLSSYRKWDRGGRPADPRKAQALVEVLETPMEILWPPESNPAVASALHAVRLQRANEEAEARDKQRHLETEGGLHKADDTDTSVWAEAPVLPGTVPPAQERTEPGPRRVPHALDLVATLDGKDDIVPGVTLPRRRRRRFLIPAAVSLAVVAVAGTAIATTGGDAPTTRPASAAQIGPSPAERERATQRDALARAQQRGDYDAAITVATQLNDTTTVDELRSTASEILARRARQAAERGDLPLATSRLDRAEDRYGNSSALDAVRRRIDQIADARKKRAADRKRAAKRRAAARARTAAAARRRAPAQSTTPPSSSAPASPSTPAPAPSSPNPSPSPSPPAGGSGGGSGGGSSSGGGSKGGGSSNGGAVDPGIF